AAAHGRSRSDSVNRLRECSQLAGGKGHGTATRNCDTSDTRGEPPAVAATAVYREPLACLCWWGPGVVLHLVDKPFASHPALRQPVLVGSCPGPACVELHSADFDRYRNSFWYGTRTSTSSQ